MSLALSRPRTSTSSPSAPAFDARLLHLHSVFAHLDSISHDHPTSQSLTLPKLKDALTIYSSYTFTQPPDSSTPAPLADKRRRRVAEEERSVQDMLDAVDSTRNGRIEFSEFVQLMDEDARQGNKVDALDGDDDDEWKPTKEVSSRRRGAVAGGGRTAELEWRGER